jgi:hypothetical protein
MLEFASLFLGLVWGQQPIQMVVGDPNIVKVEFRLDGRTATTLTAPPWKTEIDFGRMAPHRLEVLGLSAKGEELGRAEQWINVPRPQADARLVIEQDAAGRKTHARLTWDSVTGNDPATIELRFDGETLSPPDPRRFALPAANPDEIHFLTAELVFPDDTTAHAEATFGGLYGDQVETELTAYVVTKEKRGAKLEPLYECFNDRDGNQLRVATVERGAAEVLMVRDRGLDHHLALLRVSAPTLKGKPQPLLGTPQSNSRVDFSETMRYEMKLEKKDRVRLVWPNLRAATHGELEGRALFESSPILTAELGGLFYFLTRVIPPRPEGEQHLADAVALAGLTASAEGRRRAVVLVLGEETPEDHSTRSAAEVRSFLEMLQVPVVVWWGGRGVRPARDWPEGVSLATLPQVKQAAHKLEVMLDRQVVVWLSGRHLPSQVRFAAEKCPGFLPLVAAPPAEEKPAAGG